MAKDAEYKVALPSANIRPDSIITQADALMLDVYILTNMKWVDVWMMFKGKTGTKVANSTKASQYLGLHDVKIYIEERCRQLNAYITKTAPAVGGTSDSNEVTKEDFKQILRISVDHAKDVNDPLHIDATKALLPKAVKALEADEKQEPPRRYLPVTCSICRYKIFAEEEAIDECELCKYKQYANEHGVEYTPQTQLQKQEDYADQRKGDRGIAD